MMSSISFSGRANTPPVSFSSNRSSFASVQSAQQPPVVKFGADRTWKQRLWEAILLAITPKPKKPAD